MERSVSSLVINQYARHDKRDNVTYSVLPTLCIGSSKEGMDEFMA